MKAFLWALYLPEYPSLSVEIGVGDRYKPDVIARRDDGTPLFWGESGKVGREKIRSLARRHRDTHFAMAKWRSSLEPFVAMVREAVGGLHRSAPFDVLRFPEDSAERFIDAGGCVQVSHNDLEWERLW